MCTILCYAGGAVGPEELRGYLLRAQHRGPDDARLARTPFGYLGFARLAIMGLTPEGMQPFEDGGSWAACNGEIYGFRPLRRELEAKGYRFRSDSDCEVLPAAVARTRLRYVPAAGRRVRLRFVRRPKRQPCRRARPHRHPAAVLRPRQGGRHRLCQRGHRAGRLGRRDPPLPPGHYYKDGSLCRTPM